MDEIKYTLAKYTNLNETRIIKGNFQNIQDMLTTYCIDTTKYFVIKTEVRDDKGSWITIPSENLHDDNFTQKLQANIDSGLQYAIVSVHKHHTPKGVIVNDF